ncbi:transglutaminase domain-containing protein [Paenibacillus algicola]|uniref:Transglutaminase domain-containing protein n=1 Tax=Paenibacillus algicola TaxID=2565926 RepID=A0A4P8XHV4_9BACL|nr:transglutaminaseTgpA domain-containing protein [Paenibacillus algicola]QCT02126.1 transglutaminase domain-containing protein [Paenibacillus algicola]
MTHKHHSSWLLHILKLLWIWLLLQQWVSFTEPLLFEETTAGIMTALAITAVIEAMVFLKRIIRVPLQLALIVYAVFQTLSSYSIPVPDRLGEIFRDDQYQHVLPYIWFALAAWAIFNFIAVWVNSKRKVLLVVGLNIVAFGILDSFTATELWKETAWVAGIGMAWLVTEHFNRFRRRFPQGWALLRRNPLKILGNILVIFSLIIFAGVNMPTVQPSLTDPYTAWREWRGMPLSSGSGGLGGLGTLLNPGGESTSGYGREDNNLGGGFNFDYSPVMSIASEERSYWRGETRSTYSGTGWTNRQRTRGSQSIDPGQQLPSEGQGSVPSTTVEQSVTMLNDEVYPVLFGAYSMSRVDEVELPQDSELRWKREGAELHFTSESRQPAYPKQYTVTSEIPMISWEELKEKSADELYANAPMDVSYYQIPSDFPDRVRGLAEEVTQNGDTPYEKVLLLQQYLQSSEFSYTNAPDLSNKRSDDFVDSFLFEIQEGYCDYFSTSMVMMARSLDIPARWVKGYAPGNVPNEQYMSPDGTRTASGSYTVTNADAHSWAEIYFGEYGWIPVEATPGFTMPILAGAEPQEPVAEEEPEEETPAEEEEEEEQAAAPAASASEDSGSLTALLGTAAGIVLLLWLGYVIWRRRWSFRFLRARLSTGKPLTPADKVVAETERWLRSVRRKGLQQGHNETLRESVLRWREQQPALTPLLEPLLRRFEHARYSPVQVEPEAWRAVQEDAVRLKKGIKKAKTV